MSAPPSLHCYTQLIQELRLETEKTGRADPHPQAVRCGAMCAAPFTAAVSVVAQRPDYMRLAGGWHFSSFLPFFLSSFLHPTSPFPPPQLFMRQHYSTHRVYLAYSL
jgi:hypothetical protein